MGLFDWKIKVDFEEKIIKIRSVDSIVNILELIEKEFISRSSEPPIDIELVENGLTLKLLNDWKFDAKTISVMKEKDNRRYKNIRTSDATSISSIFKRS